MPRFYRDGIQVDPRPQEQDGKQRFRHQNRTWAARTRTWNLLIQSQTFYQLNYGPSSGHRLGNHRFPLRHARFYAFRRSPSTAQESGRAARVAKTKKVEGLAQDGSHFEPLPRGSPTRPRIPRAGQSNRRSKEAGKAV